MLLNSHCPILRIINKLLSTSALDPYLHPDSTGMTGGFGSGLDPSFGCKIFPIHDTEHQSTF